MSTTWSVTTAALTVGVCAALVAVASAGGPPRPSTPPEADFKKSCEQVPVADLTRAPDSHRGKRVRVTGRILVMGFPTETDTGPTPFGIILSVEDPASTRPSGVLPVYVSYPGETDSFIYGTVTVWGTFAGSFEYASPQIEAKTLPRVDAANLEKHTSR